MFDLREMDGQTPGGVYLCQVSETVSCGACCGLYNVADVSRQSLTAMLAFRTEQFARIPRNIDDILLFEEDLSLRESRQRPFPEFHHCPYIGLIGKNRSRVGCLLHPLAEGNNGVDYRGLSFYGGLACGMYFCPSCHQLPGVYKKIARTACGDWYLYGLMITETRILSAFFQEIENRLMRPLASEKIMENSRFMDAVIDFFTLKLTWPFRRRPERLVNYFFSDGLYEKEPVDYGQSVRQSSKYHELFHELESRFTSEETLGQAEGVMEQTFERLISSFDDKKKVSLSHQNKTILLYPQRTNDYL